MKSITQNEMRRLYPELASSLNMDSIQEPNKRGDGSRYGARHERGVMNKTETEYSLILESFRQIGNIAAWEFEPERIELGERCTYLPDFKVTHNDGTLEFIDVKTLATVNQTTITKLKWLKSRFPQYRVIMETKLPKKRGWKRREF